MYKAFENCHPSCGLCILCCADGVCCGEIYGSAIHELTRKASVHQF